MLEDRIEAQRICKQLLSTPVAPGAYSHIINVGTNEMLDVLENEYFKNTLAEGVSCLKYLQGYYGSGKTQFIHSLAARAWRQNIVTSIVDIGNDCPFNSPLAIYKAVVSSFLPPPEIGKEPKTEKGIEVLMDYWIGDRLRKFGLGEGQEVNPQVRLPIERTFSELFLGARDVQTALGLNALGKIFLNLESGASFSVADGELISWMRGDNIRSRNLKDAYGLSEPASDSNAFNRLMTVITFFRKRLGFRGFFIAFDEGTRTASFRRGSTKQKQAIENMLTLINKNKDGEFSGVMFLYAATPDFRSDVISKYVALNDRIGDVSFSPGRPMVPFIDLDSLDTEEIIRQIGQRLIEVFSLAYDVKWEADVLNFNIEAFLSAEKSTFGVGSEIRRAFVYHFCIYLNLLVSTSTSQKLLSAEEAAAIVRDYRLPKTEEN